MKAVGAPGWMRKGASWSATQRGALVSVGWPGRTRAGLCHPPMPSGWPRNKARAFGRLPRETCALGMLVH
jgi:hypothetical protein